MIHPPAPPVPLFRSYHILSSSLIYCWTDAQQHWILNTILSILGSKDWYKYCHKSFVFSLVNPSDTGPTKLPLIPKRASCAIYCRSGFGPTFGVGYDLHICGQANLSAFSYSSLGNTYECPPHINPSTFLCGNENFIASELEVFCLKKWA